MDDKKLIEYLKQRVEALEVRVKKLERLAVVHHRAIIKKGLEEKDHLFQEAIKLIKQFDVISITLIQRRLKVNYAKANKIMEKLEREGFISSGFGETPRKVLLVRDS